MRAIILIFIEHLFHRKLVIKQDIKEKIFDSAIEMMISQQISIKMIINMYSKRLNVLVHNLWILANY